MIAPSVRRAGEANAFSDRPVVTACICGAAGRGCVLGFTSGHAIEGDPGLSCVFVPGAPNPTTGKLYFVPTTRCIRLEMTPQDALKLIISGGNYVPAAVGKGTVGRYPLPGQW